MADDVYLETRSSDSRSVVLDFIIFSKRVNVIS